VKISLSLAFVLSLSCVEAAAPHSSARTLSWSTVSIASDRGVPIQNLFAGVKEAPKMLEMFRPRPKATCSSIRSAVAAAPGTWNRLTQHVVSLFTTKAVKAQSCPTCTPISEACTGFYMVNVYSVCYQGCNYPEIIPHFTAFPGVGTYQDGWCYSGNTVCSPCGVCQERSCTHGLGE